MPISTLYASPENRSSDLFWAFHPNRATVPSLPLLFAWPEIAWPARTILGRPRILRSFFLGASLTWFARIALSGICSIRPAPNTGVGMRKITLRRASSFPKSGCASAQPGASARPAIVNRSWTPPSFVPSAFFTNLASRTGPFSVTNEGTLLVAPFAAANATCGFSAGLVPPTAGCKWQPAQLSRFIAGPRPSATFSTSSKSSLPALNDASSVRVRPTIGAPAPAVPPRIPGSRAAEDESSGSGNSSRKTTNPMAASISSATTTFFMAAPSSQKNRPPLARILRRGEPACQHAIMTTSFQFSVEGASRTRRRLRRLDQLRPVELGIVDEKPHLPVGERLGRHARRGDRIDFLRIGELAVEPGRVRALGQHHGRPLVDFRKRPRRGGGDDRAGTKRLARLRIFPPGREPGEAQQRAVLSADEMRLFHLPDLAGRRIDALDRLPLVPALRRNEAARSGPGVAPHRLRGRLLQARVESRFRRLRLLPPVRHEAPAPGGELELVRARGQAQKVNRVGGKK